MVKFRNSSNRKLKFSNIAIIKEVKTMKIIKNLFQEEIRSSFLKESFQEEEWYQSLVNRPGIEERIPYFKTKAENKKRQSL